LEATKRANATGKEVLKDWEEGTVLMNKKLLIIKLILYKSPISLIHFMTVYKIT
jgi:hypothetical protein